MAEVKPFCISKWAVLEAWTKVRANKGAAGVDGESVAGFEKKLNNNLPRAGTTGRCRRGRICRRRSCG
jgi:RNA-directed DNA polymerase